MQNLYRRKGVWYGRIWVNGRDERRSLRTGNRAEALKRLAVMRDQVQHLKFHGEARAKYSAAVTRWTEEFLPSKRPATQARYRVSARQLDPHFGDKYLDQITRRSIADYISERKKEKVSNATIRRDLTALSRILACGVGWGWIEANPALSFDRSLLGERRDPIVLPAREDIDRFLDRLPDQFARAVRFLAETGMRQQEALQLEWRQVTGNHVQLVRTKTNRPRVVQLNDAALGTLPAQHITSPYVFWTESTRDGVPSVGPFQNFASRFAGYMRRAVKAGKVAHPFRCHDLRHWFAVRWLREGGDIYALSRHLGHSSVKTTEIYLNYVGRDQQAPGTPMGTSETVSAQDRRA
jgi:integrase